MKKTQRINNLIWLLLLALIAVGSACSLGKANAQRPTSAETVRRQPTESPTPAYKPLKRVSRDVIDTDKTETDKKADSSKKKAK